MDVSESSPGGKNKKSDAPRLSGLGHLPYCVAIKLIASRLFPTEGESRDKGCARKFLIFVGATPEVASRLNWYLRLAIICTSASRCKYGIRIRMRFFLELRSWDLSIAPHREPTKSRRYFGV
jgi:hypothetical protein